MQKNKIDYFPKLNATLQRQNDEGRVKKSEMRREKCFKVNKIVECQ